MGTAEEVRVTQSNGLSEEATLKSKYEDGNAKKLQKKVFSAGGVACAKVLRWVNSGAREILSSSST